MSRDAAPADPVALAASLRDIGIDCAVEARERLAVIVVGDAASLERPERRDAALALAAAHGFTHLALDLGDAGPDAGAGPAIGPDDRAAVRRD
jgi:hypothetical protein